MLSIEEKKRCIEEYKPDGYSITYQEKWNSHTINTPVTTGITFLDNWDREITFKGDYPLFLQRVIEGINIRANNDRNFIYLIVQNHLGIFVKDHYDYEDLLHEKGLDEKAKEQAIKYILGEI